MGIDDVVRVCEGRFVVVGRPDPNRAHPCGASAGDVGPSEITDVHGVLRGHVEGFEGGLEDPGMRLRKAPLVGEDRGAEGRQETVAIEERTHDAAGGEARIADQRAADSGVAESLERVPGAVDRSDVPGMGSLFECGVERVEGGVRRGDAELFERPVRDLAGARGDFVRPQLHVTAPGGIEGASGFARFELPAGRSCGGFEGRHAQAVRDFPAIFDDQGLPAIESDGARRIGEGHARRFFAEGGLSNRAKSAPFGSRKGPARSSFSPVPVDIAPCTNTFRGDSARGWPPKCADKGGGTMGFSQAGRHSLLAFVWMGLAAVIFSSSACRSSGESEPASGESTIEVTSEVTAEITTEETRAVMHELLGALRTLLPQAVAGELGDPERKAQQAAALASLRNRAQALSTHGSPLPTGSRLLATALVEDARRAEGFFERGRYESAGFLVARMVDDCTGCHSRTAAADAPISAGFVDADGLEGLDLLERAEIAAATRRFDRSLSLYEEAFAKPSASPDVLLAPITRYLVVALRVAREPDRAAKTIGGLRDRAGTAPEVAKDLAHWHRALEETSRDELKGTNVEAATSAMERAEALARYPADRRPLVDYLIASTRLNDLVSQPQDSPETAAALYELLGRAEFRIAQNIWQTRADLYWEAAIRLAPASPAARRAFDALEREVRAGYTGSGGVRLPAEEAERIASLRALVDDEGASALEGAELFTQHCAICHGMDAKGRGRVAGDLYWHPADLTRIADRRGGAFPRDVVFALISRRDPLGAHQSPEMPRWGKFWRDDARIEALVDYLERIQVR